MSSEDFPDSGQIPGQMLLPFECAPTERMLDGVGPWEALGGHGESPTLPELLALNRLGQGGVIAEKAAERYLTDVREGRAGSIRPEAEHKKAAASGVAAVRAALLSWDNDRLVESCTDKHGIIDVVTLRDLLEKRSIQEKAAENQRDRA